MCDEHPVKQEICQIDLGDHGGSYYRVGVSGVTRIEACEKSGMHANIAYVRVWGDDGCMAEFCQHNLSGIYFRKPS